MKTDKSKKLSAMHTTGRLLKVAFFLENVDRPLCIHTDIEGK